MVTKLPAINVLENDTGRLTVFNKINDLIDALNAQADGSGSNVVGAVEDVDGLSVEEIGNGATRKTVLTLLNVAMPVVDGATPGTDGAWGTKKLYTFPKGGASLLGVFGSFDAGAIEASSEGSGLTATADLELGVGSVASANASAFGLEDGTQENILGALDVDLVDSVSDAAEAGVNSAGVYLDGTTTAAAVHLNARTLDDADSGIADSVLTVSGTITMLWSVLGAK